MKTTAFYQNNATAYIQQTKDVDMQAHYQRFLPHLPKGATVLDVGFGSGRDMLYFQRMGYRAEGIDIVPTFVEKAKEKGLCVCLQDVHALSVLQKYDGIWAVASLLHSHDLEGAFCKIADALKSGGVLYVSMKLGKGSRIEGDRFYQYVEEADLRALCDYARLQVKEVHYTKDNLGRNQDWISILARKA